MKKIFILTLISVLLASVAFASAGSSYNRSSSSSRSSGSSNFSSSKTTNTPTYSRHSYTAPTSTASTARPSYTTQHRSSYTQSAPQQTTINRTTINRTTNNDSSGSNGGGLGIGGTMLGVAGGVVAGNMLSSALQGDHRNQGYAPQGGYANTPQGYPQAGQPVAPQMAGAESGSYITDGQGGYMPTQQGQQVQPTQQTQAVSLIKQEDSNSHGFFYYVFMTLLWGTIIYGAFVMIPKFFKARERRIEQNEMFDAELNLVKFKSIFLKVQSSYVSSSKINLIDLLSQKMYTFITAIKSENEEQGLTNIMEDVKILDITNLKSWEENGIKHQKVKIRFSSIDYVVDENNNVTHGSKEKPEIVVEVWTFVSHTKDNWIVDEISEYNGYVHQN